MNKVIQVLLLTVFCLGSCKQKPENVIADIMKHYEKINSTLKDYKVKQVDDITSPASGTITGYYREDEIKKIESEHFTDTSRTFSEYYFDDGMLIFIIKQNFIYNRPNTYTEEVAKAKGDSVWYDDKKTRMEITKFYFSNNKLLKWVAPNDKEVPAITWAQTNKEAALWAETIVLIKELKEQ